MTLWACGEKSHHRCVRMGLSVLPIEMCVMDIAFVHIGTDVPTVWWDDDEAVLGGMKNFVFDLGSIGSLPKEHDFVIINDAFWLDPVLGCPVPIAEAFGGISCWWKARARRDHLKPMRRRRVHVYHFRRYYSQKQPLKCFFIILVCHYVQ